jgi:hypothetical protein
VVLNELSFRFNRRTSASRGKCSIPWPRLAVLAALVPFEELVKPQPIVLGARYRNNPHPFSSFKMKATPEKSSGIWREQTQEWHGNPRDSVPTEFLSLS